MACSSRRSVAEYGSSDIRSPSSNMPTSRSRVPMIGTMSRTPRFSIQRCSLAGSVSLKSAGKSRITFASSINRSSVCCCDNSCVTSEADEECPSNVSLRSCARYRTCSDVGCSTESMRVLTRRAISASESRWRTSSIRCASTCSCSYASRKKRRSSAVCSRCRDWSAAPMAAIQTMFSQPEPWVSICPTVRSGFLKIEKASSATGRTSNARSAARANRYWSPRRTITRTSNNCSFQTAVAIEAGMASIARKVGGYTNSHVARLTHAIVSNAKVIPTGPQAVINDAMTHRLRRRLPGSGRCR